MLFDFFNVKSKKLSVHCTLLKFISCKNKSLRRILKTSALLNMEYTEGNGLLPTFILVDSFLFFYTGSCLKLRWRVLPGYIFPLFRPPLDNVQLCKNKNSELIFYLVQIARAQPSFQIFCSVDQLPLSYLCGTIFSLATFSNGKSPIFHASLPIPSRVHLWIPIEAML